MRGGADSTLREKLSRREGIDRENEISRTVFCPDNGQDGPMYFTFCSNVLYTLVQKYWDTFFFSTLQTLGPVNEISLVLFFEANFFILYTPYCMYIVLMLYIIELS